MLLFSGLAFHKNAFFFLDLTQSLRTFNSHYRCHSMRYSLCYVFDSYELELAVILSIHFTFQTIFRFPSKSILNDLIPTILLRYMRNSNKSASPSKNTVSAFQISSKLLPEEIPEDDECSSTTKDSIYHIKYMYIHYHSIGWTSNWNV